MKFYLLNISNEPARILADWVDPGKKKDLEAAFKNYSVSTPRQKAQFGEGDFDKFISWVAEAIKNLRHVWELKTPKNYKVKGSEEEIGIISAAEQHIKDEVSSFEEDATKFKGHHIAFIDNYDSAKKVIERYQDPNELKVAERILINLAGKERIRELVIKRIRQLESLGKYVRGLH